MITQRFCFPVKIKSAREIHFRPFFDFFHGRISGFRTHFLLNFHGQSKVFTDVFWDFFTGGFSFSKEGTSKFLIFFTEARVQKKIHFTKFHGKGK